VTTREQTTATTERVEPPKPRTWQEFQLAVQRLEAKTGVELAKGRIRQPRYRRPNHDEVTDDHTR
jgi:hypothetical protein